MTQKTKPAGKFLRQTPRSHIPGTIALGLLLGISCLCFFAAAWYRNTYGDTGFDSILYTLSSGLGGVQAGLLLSFGLKALLPAAACTALGSWALIRLRGQRGRRTGSRALALSFSLLMLGQAAFSTGLPGYIHDRFQESAILRKNMWTPVLCRSPFRRKSGI